MSISSNIKIICIFTNLFSIKDGDFLVRESQGSPGQYVLTGMNNGTPKHLLLIDPEGVVSIARKQHSATYESYYLFFFISLSCT